MILFGDGAIFLPDLVFLFDDSFFGDFDFEFCLDVFYFELYCMLLSLYSNYLVKLLILPRLFPDNLFLLFLIGDAASCVLKEKRSLSSI